MSWYAPFPAYWLAQRSERFAEWLTVECGLNDDIFVETTVDYTLNIYQHHLQSRGPVILKIIPGTNLFGLLKCVSS
jgi:hypothetical protein